MARNKQQSPPQKSAQSSQQKFVPSSLSHMPPKNTHIPPVSGPTQQSTFMSSLAGSMMGNIIARNLFGNSTPSEQPAQPSANQNQQLVPPSSSYNSQIGNDMYKCGSVRDELRSCLKMNSDYNQCKSNIDDMMKFC
jgi:hypothetical protein